MTKGFEYLESGQFKEAEFFFEDLLKKEPNNKTATLCYGRAVGLSGKPKKAKGIFLELLTEFPNDFEIKINYYESFLWAKEYQAAKPLYKKLANNNPEKFGALLGYANTLSNLKEYKTALQWIEKALKLSPQNNSAKISRKYILLGYANQYVKNQEYSTAESFLKKIFLDFPEDKDALANLANLYLNSKQLEQAKSTFTRYATNTKDSITALNGIALAEHINEQDKKALKIALQAKKKAHTITDIPIKEQTENRYVQALIWNKKYTKAQLEIDRLNKYYANKNWVLALEATLGMYQGNFNKSIGRYTTILEKDSTSFDGNLGKANALFANDEIISSYFFAKKTLQYYTNQKDATSLIDKIDVLHTPSIEEHISYTFDNGNNTAISSRTSIQLPLSTKCTTTLSYGYRTTENTVTKNNANSQVILGGLHYKVWPKTTLKVVLGVNQSTTTTNSYSLPVVDIRLNTIPLKLQNLELIYTKEVQNFNADLLEREIIMHHYGLTYNLATNFNAGWYTQLMHTQQTDLNTRNLLFSSLYYNLFKKPAAKVGINYQYISFANQVPSIYFSPSIYQALELFAELKTALSDKTDFSVSAASGYQIVEKDPKTVIFRAETGLQHQFSKRVRGNFYGKYSTIASATAAGFEFTEIGFKIQWLFTKKPLFYKKLQQLVKAQEN